MLKQGAKRYLLIIDDDLVFCKTVRDLLQSEYLAVDIAHTGADGLDQCANRRVDLVLLDQKLPDGDGRGLCPSILAHNSQTKIIFVTAYPSFDNAVEAIKAGAHDYVSKPFEIEELRLAVNQALRTLDLERFEQVQIYKGGKECSGAVLVGEDGGLAETARLAKLAASSGAPVLITGETGTGKNVVAKAIHYTGHAKSSPFISINCAALPENLIEAELFGFEKGAFTGAEVSRKGIFEMAEGGTLLMDEIGDMPLHLQSKLLSVLEDGEIKRLGGDSIRPVDVRVVAATNKDLEEAARTKCFREDLYYRLSVIRIHIPPLRERYQDIPELSRYILTKSYNGKNARISDEEMEKLTKYDWPGNVRELKNIIERALILHGEGDIRPSELIGESSPCKDRIPAAPGGETDIQTLEEVEKKHILHALDRYSGNITRTSAALGISLSTLKRKLKTYQA